MLQGVIAEIVLCNFQFGIHAASAEKALEKRREARMDSRSSLPDRLALKMLADAPQVGRTCNRNGFYVDGNQDSSLVQAPQPAPPRRSPHTQPQSTDELLVV